MSIAAALVYILCLATSGLCAFLLVRSYRKTKTRLLLWSAACFILLAVNNIFVTTDMFLLPDIDLTLLRDFSLLAAVAILLYGFIWEVDG